MNHEPQLKQQCLFLAMCFIMNSRPSLYYIWDYKFIVCVLFIDQARQNFDDLSGV